MRSVPAPAPDLRPKIYVTGAAAVCTLPVTSTEAIALLRKFRGGQISEDKVLRAFQAAAGGPRFRAVDLHRSLRKNFPEVIYGEGKTRSRSPGSRPKSANANSGSSSHGSTQPCARSP